MIKLSDYVMDFLVARGARDLFTVSGGGIMHLLDSAGRARGLRVWCNYNEQASSICAEANARIRGVPGTVLVTTGPGSTNALTGVACAYVDSIPMIVLAGQVRTDIIADYTKTRQLGPQEIDSVGMAQPITKWATTVVDPREIRRVMEKAYRIATTGRPGPVWISVPLDVQSAMIDPGALDAGDDAREPGAPAAAENAVRAAIDLVRRARRPVIIAGNGIHLAGAEETLQRFVARVKAPTLVTINALDLLDEDDPFALGRIGPSGQRRANFALQNADLVLSIGASMAIASIGFNTAEFAPKAKRAMVNIDRSELDKPNYVPDLKVQADAGQFMERFLALTSDDDFEPSPRWLDACADWKRRYPLLSEEHYANPDYVNTYVFVDRLSRRCAADDAVVTGNSLDIVSAYQAWRVKRGQRVFTNANFGPMGWDLPAAVGVAAARQGRRTICFTGDGTLVFNVQELLTIGFHRMNVKIFVINNDGYNSIRTTQTNYFDGRFVGASRDSGIGNPDFVALAQAMGLRYHHVGANDGIDAALDRVLGDDEPWLCELHVHPDQGRTPRVTSYRREDGTMASKPLHDMFPFLPEDEVRANMTLFDHEPVEAK